MDFNGISYKEKAWKKYFHSKSLQLIILWQGTVCKMKPSRLFASSMIFLSTTSKDSGLSIEFKLLLYNYPI